MPDSQELAPFLDSPRCDAQDLFDTQRFPNLVTMRDGAVVATWGGGWPRLASQHRRRGDVGARGPARRGRAGQRHAWMYSLVLRPP